MHSYMLSCSTNSEVRDACFRFEYTATNLELNIRTMNIEYTYALGDVEYTYDDDDAASSHCNISGPTNIFNKIAYVIEQIFVG